MRSLLDIGGGALFVETRTFSPNVVYLRYRLTR